MNQVELIKEYIDEVIPKLEKIHEIWADLGFEGRDEIVGEGYKIANFTTTLQDITYSLELWSNFLGNHKKCKDFIIFIDEYNTLKVILKNYNTTYVIDSINDLVNLESKGLSADDMDTILKFYFNNRKKY